ncbi:MAG: WD40/YVTN/BNR-like repeat-containing protein [Candidatus Aminicenantaceae bacterium]
MKTSQRSVFLNIFGIILFLLFCAFNSYSQSAAKIDKVFEKLSWRCIGPAVMGGRTVDIDVVEKKPWIIYAAIGPSGVWKSENNGITWDPVFHKENTVSVGDIAVSQSHPGIIWVGTGEATCRNSVTIGDGVYKSADGGKTWENMGLKETRHISRILINPGDPNIVYVAAMGHLWGSNKERGVYKTVDGGKTWEKILYINKDTGFVDLAMDPSDSLILYAASYEHRRMPYYFSSGGPGSGIYKSEDAGKTWKRLEKDLPEGIMGRIGVAVSRSNPEVVYALIEHKDGGIWRSEDKGESWKRMCDNKTYKLVNYRPFYYSQIRVDPTDDKVVYVFSGGLFVSENMGKNFIGISGGTHADHHALWIDPANPLHLVDGNDGGIDVTYDRGKNWYDVQCIPAAEVYQIGFDMRYPYYVYCGLQDNGLWGGPSTTLDARGITNDQWYKIGGGDGFYAQVDPTDPNTIFGNYQMNGLYRYDLKIKRRKNIKPLASLEEPPYRFNWNAPIHISPHDPRTVYTGGNYLFKTTDSGHSWQIISPDLSTNDSKKQRDSGGSITLDNTGAEIHCTIITISESSVEEGVIWCGTDDGNVQVTIDGGENWENVVNNIRGLPPNTWCSRIEASHFHGGTAYVAFDGHRHDDYNTYLYKTTNYGYTWKSIRSNLPFGWVHVIREDLKNENLLFVGTEFGIYASLDSGDSWFSLMNNLPTVAVRDIAIHPRENDLIIGTHGRGIWIMDDISPLQEMSEEVLESDLHLFNIRPATMFLRFFTGETSSRPVFSGKNSPYGMMITSYVKTVPKEKPKLSIIDKADKVIFEISIAKKAGIQRNTWNLRFTSRTIEGKKIKASPTGFYMMPYVFPGEYTIELSVGEMRVKKKTVVHSDSRIIVNEQERDAQIEAITSTMVLSKKMGLSVTAAKNIRRELDRISKSLEELKETPELVTSAIKDFEGHFRPLEEVIMPKGIGYRGSMEMALRGGSVYQQILSLGSSISGYHAALTETDVFRLKELSREVDMLVNKLNEIINVKIPELNKLLNEHQIKTLKVPKEVKL